MCYICFHSTSRGQRSVAEPRSRTAWRAALGWSGGLVPELLLSPQMMQPKPREEKGLSHGLAATSGRAGPVAYSSQGSETFYCYLLPTPEPDPLMAKNVALWNFRITNLFLANHGKSQFLRISCSSDVKLYRSLHLLGAAHSFPPNRSPPWAPYLPSPTGEALSIILVSQNKCTFSL